jgi:integrase
MGPHVMSRPPKYVHGFVDRHGKPRFYFRRPRFKQVPLPGLPWTPEFMEAYAAAMNEAQPIIIGASRTKPGTVAEAVARYLGSTAFTPGGFAPSTQAMRRAILERFRVEHGDKRIRKLEPQHVARLIDKLKPFAQRNMLKTLRGLMVFAVAEDLIRSDPTADIKLARVKDTGGFETWTYEHIEQYRHHHKLGTRSRLALELLYGSMQRRGDVVLIGRQHITDGILSLRQQKTGADIDIPVLPELQNAIDAMPKLGHLTFLVTEQGKPFTAAGFGGWFREQCDLAKLPRSLSAHGLRKAGATRLADNGATDHEIMAWGGWSSLSEVQRYTKAANRKRAAQRGAEKLKAGTKVANLETRFANQRKKS